MFYDLIDARKTIESKYLHCKLVQKLHCHLLKSKYIMLICNTMWIIDQNKQKVAIYQLHVNWDISLKCSRTRFMETDCKKLDSPSLCLMNVLSHIRWVHLNFMQTWWRIIYFLPISISNHMKHLKLLAWDFLYERLNRCIGY